MKHFRSLLNWMTRAISLILTIIIKGYQRFISPYKNYQCAHHIHKGDLSCSANALHALEKENLFIALNKIFQRRKECHQIACEHGFSYQKLYLKSGLAVVALSAVTGCGGSDDGGTKNNIDETTNEVAIDVKVDKSVLPTQNEEYFIVANGESERLENSELETNVKNGSLDVVLIADEVGEPYLMAWKYPNATDVKVDIRSSAVLFFLMRPEFYGGKFKDEEAVSEYIQSHPDFEKLVNALEQEIKDNSPCPLDPLCSADASIIAQDMFESMNFEDLMVTGAK